MSGRKSQSLELAKWWHGEEFSLQGVFWSSVDKEYEDGERDQQFRMISVFGFSHFLEKHWFVLRIRIEPVDALPGITVVLLWPVSSLHNGVGS